MKNEKPNAEVVWKQVADVLVPRLRLSFVDRAIYFHLVRHSRLEGKARLHFSIYWLAGGTLVSSATAREAVRRLVAIGALRLIERTKAGHVVEVRLPDEIPAVRADKSAARNETQLNRAADIEETDFLENKELREAIHEREHGACFYCLRRLTARARCLDHVVPRVRGGDNSYRNLVSSCGDCNSQKGEEEAGDFLRRLYRHGRLTAEELSSRLSALEVLAAGDLRPVLTAPKPQFAGGAPKPTPPSSKRFPVRSVSHPRKPRVQALRKQQSDIGVG